MSSPFKFDDFRSKAFVWALAILLGGIILFVNQHSIGERITAVLDAPEITEFVQSFSEITSPVDSILSGDSDNDGLDNALEVVLASDISKKDTDGDGFSDYDEFLSGYSLIEVGGDAIAQEELNQYFAFFNEQFSGTVDIEDFYYRSRFEGLYEAMRYEELVFIAQQAPLAETLLTEYINAFLQEEEYFFALELAKVKQTNYPESISTYFTLGYTAQQLNQDAEAKAFYLQGAERGSKEPALYNNLGVIADTENQKEEAIGHFRRAYELDPKRDIYKTNLKNALRDNGQEEEASLLEQS